MASIFHVLFLGILFLSTCGSARSEYSKFRYEKILRKNVYIFFPLIWFVNNHIILIDSKISVFETQQALLLHIYIICKCNY